MKSGKQHSAHYQSGFSLVEILVGLVIGLLATLVIMQVFTVFEGQKRTTTGSSDAQTNGSIALYTLGRELKMAGYTLLPVTDSPLECTALSFGATGITDISPATITDGGAAAGASDSISVRYGNSASGGVPTQITGVGLPGANDVTVDSNLGCQAGDITLVTNGNACALSSASAVPGTTTVTLADNTGAIANANLSCLGAWTVALFQVNPNYDPVDPANSQAYLERNGVPSVADIVNIQAQYGISASSGSNLVTQWVDATGSWAPAALTVADRNRIKALHIAVVARNGLLEKDIVTSTCTTDKGTVNKGPCAWDDTNVDAAPKIDLSNDKLLTDPANDQHWQHYRYRVFETIIPLRNMIWSKETL